MISAKIIMGVQVFTVIGLIGCSKATLKQGATHSSLRQINESSVRPVAGVTDSQSARDTAVKLGYFDGSRCAPGLRGGEEVMYSQGSGFVDEFGQMTGILVAQKDGIFLRQVSSQKGALMAPGIPQSDEFNSAGQMSTLEMSSYLELVCRVIFNSNGGQQTYDAATASIVNIEGGTGGLAAEYSDLLKFEFTKRSSTDLITYSVYFKKGFGPVVSEFISEGIYDEVNQKSKPHLRNRTRLFINTAGGSGVSSSPTLSKEETACQAKGGEWGTYSDGCYKKDPSVSFDQCHTGWDMVCIVPVEI